MHSVALGIRFAIVVCTYGDKLPGGRACCTCTPSLVPVLPHRESAPTGGTLISRNIANSWQTAARSVALDILRDDSF